MLGLQGNVDCIIKTAKDEYIPVEYKSMSSDKGKVCMESNFEYMCIASKTILFWKRKWNFAFYAI